MNINTAANVGLLIGEPTRTTMLFALMDGQALTATELARCANVTPQTASTHLARLAKAGLICVEKYGRHRYHRIASAQVARLLESIGQVASAEKQSSAKVVTGPRDEAMRKARVCYDHFAGRLGVAIADSLIKTRMVEFEDQSGVVTPKGIRHLARYGMDLDKHGATRRSRRPLCRPCLDWSVRRPHVAGTLGAMICSHFIDRKLVRRQKESRTILITPGGEQALHEIFGIRRLD